MNRYLIGATVTLAVACNAVLGLDPVDYDPGNAGNGGGGNGGGNGETMGGSLTGSGASMSRGGGDASGASGGAGPSTNGVGGNGPSRGGSATTNGGDGPGNTGGVGEGGEGASPGGGGTTGGTGEGGTTSDGGAPEGGTNTGGTNTGGTGKGGTTSGGGTTGGTSTGGTTTKGGATGTGGTTTKGGATGTGGTTTKGGATGTGGTTGGTSTGGASTGGTGTGGTIPISVASELNGRMLLAPCVGSTGEQNVCTTNKAGSGCPPANAADPALSGALMTNDLITIGGTVGQTYTITLHIQGEVEAKDYAGGTDALLETTISTSMNGFHTGGTPVSGDAYGVFLIRVTSPRTDYFLNDLVNLNGAAVSNHTTYVIDYTATIQAAGGTTIRLVAADSNCSMIKNCGPNNTGSACNQPLIVDSPDPTAVSANPSFSFTTPYNGQWVSIVVTKITLNSGA